MEEDIKILEELIELYKCCGVDDYPSVVVDFAVSLRDIKAIENLIVRNKELESKLNLKDFEETGNHNSKIHYNSIFEIYEKEKNNKRW